jgi:hypothetical protein
MSGDPDHAKIIIDSLTLLLGILGFFRAMYVYRQQKRRDHELAEKQIRVTEASDRLKRFDKFQDIQRRYREDEAIANVLRFLYPDHQADLKEPLHVSAADKFVFMGFYEELAIMINSGLMNPDLAYWTIGLDAATFYDNEPTWHNDRTWTLFNSFALKVKARYDEIEQTEIAGLRF